MAIELDLEDGQVVGVVSKPVAPGQEAIIEVVRVRAGPSMAGLTGFQSREGGAIVVDDISDLSGKGIQYAFPQMVEVLYPESG